MSEIDNSPETRRKFIGASELLAACVGDKYQSRGALWELKTGRRPPVQENAAMRWGNRLEQFQPLLPRVANPEVTNTGR